MTFPLRIARSRYCCLSRVDRSKMKVTLTAFLLVAALTGAMAGKNTRLPSNVPLCSTSDPNMEECLRKSVQSIVPELVKGVPNLGVLSIDPLDITEAGIGATEGPVALSLNFKKLKIRGFHTANILGVKYDPKTLKLELRVNVTDPVSLDAKYKMSGKVLVLPIQGDGLCNLKLHNVNAVLNLQGKEKVKNGETYMEVEKLTMKFTISLLQMRFENLFNGNKELGENMNRFLNENWEILIKELGPSIEDTFGAAFQEIANRIFTRVPFNTIFLP